MALRKFERRNYGGKLPVSTKYQNLHSFKDGLILLCQSILEMRRIAHLHRSVHFTIPLKYWNNTSAICLKVILQTRGIVHLGFSDTLFQYGCCIQAVIVFQWFFLWPTQQASFYYFRRIYMVWYLPHFFCRHDMFTFQKFCAMHF